MRTTEQRFKLQTDLKPAGDQPRAIEELLGNLERGVREQVLLGATGTGKSLHPEEKVLIGERHGEGIRWSLERIGDLVERLSKEYPVVRMGQDYLVLLPRDRYYAISFSPESFQLEVKPLYSVSFHREEKRLFEIELEDGRRIRTTGDHNFYVLSEEGFLLKESSQLKETDFVPIPREFPPLSEGVDCVYLTDFIEVSDRIKVLPNRIELDKDLLEFVGLYLVEGSCTDRYILISTASQYYKELAVRVANRFGLKVQLRNDRDIVVYSPLFAEFIKGLCGSGAGEKRFPPFWLNLTDEQLSHILRAMFDGDGTVDKTSVSLTTKSRALAEELLYALLKLGVWGRVREVFKRATNSQHGGNLYYRISIYGGEVERFLRKVGFNLENKRRKASLIPQLQREVKTVSTIELANLRWSRIKSLREIPYKGFVYDLSVEENETFLAGFGGVFVHNTFTLANVIANYNKPTLVVVHNKILAAQLYREFKELFPENAVEYFISYYDYYQPEAYIPEKDLYIEKDASINEILERYRHSATISVLERRDVIVVASVSCIYGLGSPEHYGSLRMKVRKGERLSLSKTVRKLVEMGYERNDYAYKRATFSVKGSALEVIPSNAEDHLVRIELWEDEVERIVLLDVLNRHVLSELEEVSLFPASHYVAPRTTTLSALEEIEKDLRDRVEWFKKQGRELEAQRLYQRTMYDIEMIRELGHCKGIENYSRYFDGRKPGEPPFTLLDYFPEDFLLIVDESHMTIPQIRAMYNGDRSRKEKLVEYGWRLPSALDNRPLRFDEFLERINQVIYVSATPGEWEMERSGGVVVEQIVRPTGLLDPEVEVRPTRNQLEDLLREIQERKRRGERALVLTTTKRLAEEVADYLTERKIKATYMHSDLDAIERARVVKELREGSLDVVVGVNLLREGLDLPEVSLVAILEADKEGFLRSYTSLIQTIGRAARNSNGKAILYADRITKSMERAIEETRRRREKQKKYNEERGITPRSVVKPVRELLALEELDYVQLPTRLPKGIRTEEDLIKKIDKLEKEMWEAAKNWEFEKAARLRDEIKKLRGYLNLN